MSKVPGTGGLLRSFLTVGAMRFLALPLTLATSVAFARVLGATDYGLFAFAMSLAGMLALPAGNGMSPLVTREAVWAVEDGSPNLVKGLRRRAAQVLGAYSLVVLVVVAAAYFGFGLGSPPVLAAAILAPVLARFEIDSALMRAFHRPVISQLSNMLLRPLAVLLASLAIWAAGHLDLASALGAQILASAVVLAVSYVLLLRALPDSQRNATPAYADRNWARAYPSFLLISTMNFMNISIGILFLGLIGDAQGASGMRVGQSAGQLVQLSLVAANMVVQPQLAARNSRGGSQNAIIRAYVHGAQLSLTGALLIGIPLFLFAGPLIGLVYGADFVPLAAVATQLLVLGQIFNATAGPSGTLLAMAGHERLAFRGQLAALVVTVALVALLSPSFGASGAAIGIMLGLVVKNGLELVFLRLIYQRWLSAFTRLP